MSGKVARTRHVTPPTPILTATDVASAPRGTRIPSPGVLLVAPNLLYLALILLAPLGMMGAYSLYAANTPGLTLANYAHLADPYFLNLLARTARIAAETAAICAVLAYPLAYFLARAPRGMATIGLLLLLTPLMVSPVVRAFGWMVLLDRHGLLLSVVRGLGFTDARALIYTEGAVLIGLVHLLLPYLVLPLTASIERISPLVEEAARDLGAGPVALFRSVILPLSLPGLISGALLVFVEALSAFVLPALLGGRKVRMIGNEVFDALLVAYNQAQASTLTVVLVGLTIATVGIGFAAARRLR
jgi:ABC-type spermidine/putrescine transport system permease subunit I